VSVVICCRDAGGRGGLLCQDADAGVQCSFCTGAFVLASGFNHSAVKNLLQGEWLGESRKLTIDVQVHA